MLKFGVYINIYIYVLIKISVSTERILNRVPYTNYIAPGCCLFRGPSIELTIRLVTCSLRTTLASHGYASRLEASKMASRHLASQMLHQRHER